MEGSKLADEQMLMIAGRGVLQLAFVVAESYGNDTPPS